MQPRKREWTVSSLAGTVSREASPGLILPTREMYSINLSTFSCEILSIYWTQLTSACDEEVYTGSTTVLYSTNTAPQGEIANPAA
jgi:hypothetical protein